MSELFFGRKEEIERFEKDVFKVEKASAGRCYSLIGQNGIGKTSLISKLAEEFEEYRPANAFYFDTTLEAGVTFWGYWSELIDQFRRTITRKVMESLPDADEELIDDICEVYKFFDEKGGLIDEDKLLSSRAVKHLNHIFEDYTDLGIRIIFTIDEFDRAKDIFKTGQFFQRLFGLTPKGGAKLNLSIVTVSRRRVSTIAHGMQEGSNFEDAYPAISLKGFSNAVLEEYFESYKDFMDEELSESVKKEILCLCGRNTGLLMSMRHEIELLHKAPASIEDIYAKHGTFVDNAYDRMYTLLKTEYVDHDKTISCLEIFLQQFIGPVYTDNLALYMDTLNKHGLVTATREDEENVYELAGLTEYRDKGNLVYEPMSPYFVDIVKDKLNVNETRTLAGLLERTERRLRTVIAQAMASAYPDEWVDLIDAVNPKKDDYLSHLRNMAAKNDAQARNISVSKLNVLAFNDYYSIISKYWDIMQPYFARYETKEELKEDMKVLNDTRNASAHLNLEVLNISNRRSVEDICKTILECTGDGGADSSADSKAVPASSAAPRAAATGPLPVIAPGTTLQFFPQEFKPKVVRGLVNGYMASIAKKDLTDTQKGRIKAAIEGGTFVEVKMREINPQGTGYLVSLI